MQSGESSAAPRHTLRETVARNICSGCGACGVASGGRIPLTLSRHRLYTPDLTGVDDDVIERASAVCPFTDDSRNEDELDAPSPAGRALPHDAHIGRYGRLLAGRHTSDDYLMGSSSGGLTSWVLDRLVSDGIVDGVLHVGRSAPGADEGAPRFSYRIAVDGRAVTDNRTSQYSSTTLAGILMQVRGDGRRYAVVGVPCFIKAGRLLAAQDATLDAQLAMYVGLVCGHLKSEFFAESLAWQLGVAPDELGAVDFRVKNPARPASDYDFAASRAGTADRVRARSRELVGGSWGHGAMQPEACNFCDDVFAETADVVFGDAWLPAYTPDWRGTNIVVTRNPVIDRLLDAGVAAGEIELEQIGLDDMVASQAGGFRHRRDGLAVRLADDIDAGLSVPRRRVAPGRDHVDERRLRLIRARREMSRQSLEWFADARRAGDLGGYLRPMREAIRRYAAIEAPLWRRLARRARRVAGAFIPSRRS